MSKTVFKWTVVVLVSTLAGYFLANATREATTEMARQGAAQSVSESAAKEPKILYWVAPMDPDFRRDGPGKSPMGMDLVPVYEEDSATDVPEDAIRIDPSVENNLGVRTAEVVRRPLWRKVDATGHLTFNEERMSRIHLRTSGWVEDLRVDTVGESVRQGQVLFRFYSPEVLNAQKEFLQSLDMNSGRMKLAGREKLRALGMEQAAIDELARTGQTTRTIEVLAPMDGILTGLSVREGMYIRPENEVLSLADLSTVWMIAEVFESQSDWVRRGQAAEARFNALPGEAFTGQLDYVYPVLDPMTRTLRVRLKFDNPGGRLKPNMYARLTLFGDVQPDALSIPRDALIRAPEINRVVVALGEGAYQGREVMTGMESGDWVEVITGLEEGERVVTSAQFLLDSEASLTGSMRRLAANSSTEFDSTARAIYGTGIVEQINRNERWLLIQHGPIDALGWPSMKMQFEVTDEVDIERLSQGQNIHFSIVPDEHGVYLVDTLHLVSEGGGDGDD